jgi:hypothetical protein
MLAPRSDWVDQCYDCTSRGHGIALVSRTSRPCISSPKSATGRRLQYWSAKANGDWTWNGLWLIITKATKPVVAWNGVIITPLVQTRLLQCTSLSLCLSTRPYIYILSRGRQLTNIADQQTPRHHHLDKHRSRLPPPIETASCRHKSNRKWIGTTSAMLHRSLQAISLYHPRGNTLSVRIQPRE